MPGNPVQTGKPYISIVGGNIVQKVDKDTPNARYREYETRDKSTAGKWELVFNSWVGKILNITFKEGDFGEQCNVELEDAILSMGTAGKYFTDFACKIFNGDLEKEFVIHPYDMEVDGGRRKTGISLQQEGEKLQNYFYNGTENINGFPEVDHEKTEKKGYWASYFGEVEEFLIEKVKGLKFPEISQPASEEEGDEAQKASDELDELFAQR